jgi:2-methylisocitrate lyase-like PEP mutase family enzyme
LIGAVQRISRRLRIPLSVDIEGGYRSSPDEVADLVAEIHGVGAVGINIGDGGDASELLGCGGAGLRCTIIAAHSIPSN